jgi:hypothetical protein
MSAHDDTAAKLRATVWRTALLQAVVGVLGAVMAWRAVACGVLGHHLDAMLCAIGVMINLLSYEIAGQTRVLAQAALAFGKTNHARRANSLPSGLIRRVPHHTNQSRRPVSVPNDPSAKRGEHRPRREKVTPDFARGLIRWNKRSKFWLERGADSHHYGLSYVVSLGGHPMMALIIAAAFLVAIVLFVAVGQVEA